MLGIGLALLVLSALVTLGAGAFAVRLRHTAGALPFACKQGGATLWTLAYTAVLLAPDLETKLFWWRVQSIGVATIPTAWLLFTLGVTAQGRRLPAWLLAALVIEPLLAVGLAWTNDFHHLMLAQAAVASVGPFETLQRAFGPALFAHATYSTVLILAGTQVLILAASRSGGLVRRQTAILIGAGLLPSAAQVWWIMRPQEMGLDPTPFTFAVSGVACLWMLTRLRFLAAPSVARDVLFVAAADAALAVSTDGYIVDGNPAAAELFGPGGQLPLGRTLDEALQGVASSDAWRAAIQAGTGEVELHQGGVSRVYELRSRQVQLDDEGPGYGVLLLLRDVTERRVIQAQLETEVTARTRAMARDRMLLRAMRRTAAESDAEQLLDHLLEAALEVLEADEASMWRWDASHHLLGITRDRGGRLTRSDTAPDATVAQTASSVARTLADGTLSVPMIHDGELFGVLSIRAAGRAFAETDADTLEILAATGTAALAARQRVRMEGVLLAARTAQHELSNRLAITAGYAALLAQHEEASESLRHLARQAERGANDAADLLRRLSQVTEIEELDWGDMGSTIDLQAPRPTTPRKASMSNIRAAS